MVRFPEGSETWTLPGVYFYSLIAHPSSLTCLSHCFQPCSTKPNVARSASQNSRMRFGVRLNLVFSPFGLKAKSQTSKPIPRVIGTSQSKTRARNCGRNVFVPPTLAYGFDRPMAYACVHEAE